VIDIGCGDDSNMLFLRQKGIPVVGVEFSAGDGAREKRKIPGIG
jgi:hypothetical protein